MGRAQGTWGTWWGFLYLRACCCVAVSPEGNDNLPPFISQLVYLVLQTAHVVSKHGPGLWVFGLLGRGIELKPHHVLPMHPLLWA